MQTQVAIFNAADMTVTLSNAWSRDDLAERVLGAFASVSDIARWLKFAGQEGLKQYRKEVEYSLARATHREGKDITRHQVRILLRLSEWQVSNYSKRVGVTGNMYTPQQVDRISSMVADYGY